MSRPELTAHIEDLLGSDGTREIAESMFTALIEAGYVHRDQNTGDWTLSEVPERAWLKLLGQVSA